MKEFSRKCILENDSFSKKFKNIKKVLYQNKQMGEVWQVGLSNLFSKKKKKN